MTPVRRTLILGFLAAIAAAASLSAQQPRPTFRTSVDVVRLDVTVLDKERRPIRDLKREDFTILVDGVEQPIVAFEPVVIPPINRALASWTREIEPDVRSNDVGEPRLFAIVMDDASAPFHDLWMGRTARDLARAIVDEMAPGDLAAVVYTFSGQKSQDFTSDRAKLLAAIDKFNSKDGPMSFGVARGTLKNLFGALRQRGVAGRAAVFWISTGALNLARFQLDRGFGNEREDPVGLITMVNELSTDARVSNLPVYGFSIAGLMAPAPDHTSAMFRSISPTFTYQQADRGLEAMQSIAERSGGRAIGRTNAPVRHVPSVMEELSAYYVVGYRATYPTDDRKNRRLRVRINRPDAYVFPDDRLLTPAPRLSPSRVAAMRAQPLNAAMSDILPQKDIPLKIAVAPFAMETKQKAGLTLTLGVRQPAPDEPQSEDVDVLTRVFTPDGRAVSRATQKATVKWARSGDAQYEMLSVLDLKPGRYLLRTSVHSPSRQKTASVYTDVTIPDFRKERLSLSGVVVSATPSPRAEPRDAVARVLPVVPTAERDFNSSQRVEAFVRVYVKKPAPVDVRATVTSETGAEVLSRHDTLTADRFGPQRATDYRLPLPLSTLAPGAYLLTLTATAGEKDVRRADVRFTVRR